MAVSAVSPQVDPATFQPTDATPRLAPVVIDPTTTKAEPARTPPPPPPAQSPDGQELARTLGKGQRVDTFA